MNSFRFLRLTFSFNSNVKKRKTLKTSIKHDKNQSLFNKMSTRSQKRRSNQQGSTENVSENLFSPVLVQNQEINEQDVVVAGHPHAKSPGLKIAL